MPEFGEYPVDYILDEIRSRTQGYSADDVEDVYSQDRTRIEEDAWEAYSESAEEPVSRELFIQAVERTFDALLGTRREDVRDKRAAAGLAPPDETADDVREVQVWKPRERMSGWFYQVEVIVDLSDPAERESGEPPLTVNTFYSIRSPQPLTHGDILDRCLSDFQAETGEEGSFPDQPILGAVITGVYHFERDE